MPRSHYENSDAKLATLLQHEDQAIVQHAHHLM